MILVLEWLTIVIILVDCSIHKSIWSEVKLFNLSPFSLWLVSKAQGKYGKENLYLK